MAIWVQFSKFCVSLFRISLKKKTDGRLGQTHFAVKKWMAVWVRAFVAMIIAMILRITLKWWFELTCLEMRKIVFLSRICKRAVVFAFLILQFIFGNIFDSIFFKKRQTSPSLYLFYTARCLMLSVIYCYM